MSEAKAKNGVKRSRLIIVAGLLIGSMDGIAALVENPTVEPRVIFQYIASSLLGIAAFRGGTATALLGLFLHFIIAFLVSGVYFKLHSFMVKLSSHWWLRGLLYGIAVWIVMNLVVIPLTRISHSDLSLSAIVTNISINMVLIGMPLAWFAGRLIRVPLKLVRAEPYNHSA